MPEEIDNASFFSDLLRSGTDVGGGDCPKCAEVCVCVCVCGCVCVWVCECACLSYCSLQYRELVDELQGDIAFKDR